MASDSAYTAEVLPLAREIPHVLLSAAVISSYLLHGHASAVFVFDPAQSVSLLSLLSHP